MMRAKYDVAVVGSGLVGSMAALELVGRGLSVLMLEAGPPVNVIEADVRSKVRVTPEYLDFASRRQPIQSQNPAWRRYPTLFVDDVDNPYVSSSATPFVWIRGRQLGGRSLLWGGVMLRFSDLEFGASEADGRGPSWPLEYSELAPFYDHVERLLAVSGTKEELPQLPDGVFAAPAGLTGAEYVFKHAVETRWSNRRVIPSRGVHRDAVSPMADGVPITSSCAHILPAAISKGLEVRSDSIVSHFEMCPDTGLATSVVGVDSKSRRRFSVEATDYVLAASTVESIRILLLSRSTRHPDGVGNASGLLGRGVMDHRAVYLYGRLPHVQPPAPLGGPHAFIIPKFITRDQQRPPRFTGGYGIWGHIGRGDIAETQAWTMTALLEVARNDLNRVTLDYETKDAWGIPCPRIDVTYRDPEWAMADHALQSMREMAGHARLPIGGQWMPPPGYYVHELGGARMGNDPSLSVLDPVNRCWDAPNVRVIDGACFPSAGWQNPTLTMMAIAVRAARHLAAPGGPRLVI